MKPTARQERVAARKTRRREAAKAPLHPAVATVPKKPKRPTKAPLPPEEPAASGQTTPTPKRERKPKALPPTREGMQLTIMERLRQVLEVEFGATPVAGPSHEITFSAEVFAGMFDDEARTDTEWFRIVVTKP